MSSTGEVMGRDRSLARAFLTAQMGAGMVLPAAGRAFISIRDTDKTEVMLATARILLGQGFDLVAARGTHGWLAGHGVACSVV
ncbi:hypothetical protein, partial [Tritonibacter sp. SIMBA_163]|uniref:hypothetical protein n=1 Tax=Tritonibacter sp. SIMBA_163 TaxID=3080868 RepID=UPI003980ED48